MTESSASALRVSTLPKTAPTPFALTPDAAETAALAELLSLKALRKLSFRGEVRPAGKRDWLLTGHLGATVVQPCSVTLAPVTTRIEEDVTRRFTPHLPDEAVEAEEVEMPEDESLEKLGSHIDPAAVMAEALALALPLYPRAEGAELGQQDFTEPGKAAMTDEDARPLAGLADLLAARRPADDEDGGKKG
ncbi:YceD family protein [Pseudooceanicola sp. 200-1SW]|uniref:YceD family protein n=1 Tax=Pseudooceanicola sp. 200-1SW TaxID=3425949 RepID=UPI003D7F8ABA